MKSFTGNLLIALATSLFFSACQQNNDSIEPEFPTSAVEEIDLKDSPYLQGLVNEISQTDAGGRTSPILDNVDFSQATRFYDSAHQTTKYTFSVVDDEAYALKNFILMEPDQGEVFGLLFTHQLDLEWYSQFDAFPGWEQFTGSFLIQNLEGELIAETRIENGKSVSSEGGRTSGITCVTEYILITERRGDLIIREYIITETTCYDSGGGSGSSADSPNLVLDPNSDIVRPPEGDLFGKPSCEPNSSYNLSTTTCECDEDFVKDENNTCVEFNLNMDDQGYKDLTSCEKELFHKYTNMVYRLSENRTLAHQKTQETFGIYGGGRGHNDCADAFRHAFFNALNTQTWNANLAKEWGDAHECDTPSSEAKEKEMDLFNNEVGRNIAIEAPNVTVETLVDLILLEMELGNLRLLSPLDGNNNLLQNSILISTENCFQ